MLLILAVCLTAAPVLGEDTDAGPTLMERGAELLMEGLLKEMRPALDGFEELGPELFGFVQQMGPALADILQEVQDWSVYEVPEILPNGDIIIRRKQDTPEGREEGVIDL